MTDTSTTKGRAERNSKRIWVSLVVLLLGLQIGIGAIAISLATSDPSVAVVPDYHEAALNWDTDKANRFRLETMGIELKLTLSDVADGRGQRALRASLVNDQATIPECTASVTAFHHSRAREVARFPMQSIGNGQFQCLIPMQRRGLWDLDFEFNFDETPARVRRTMEVQ
ncbi:MAG: FixH family protein [Planctomycetota bacterium]